MPIFKILGAAALALAFSAIGAASASAGQFTASATGTLTGKAKTVQTFTSNGGQVKCSNAAISGNILSVASEELTVSVNYSGCTAFGFAAVHITPTEYTYTASGQVHIKKTTTISVTGAGCHMTITPQTPKVVHYVKIEPFPRLFVTAATKIVTYHSTGGLCGTSGENGTFTGEIELERVGGGSLTWDK